MKIIVKLTAVFFIFVSPLIIIYQRYQTEAEEKTVVSEPSIPFIPMAFIVLIILVGLWFALQQFMNMVRQDKFGTLAITFFGLVLGGILFLAWFVITNIAQTAQDNLETFVESFNYHGDTLYYILISIIVGVTIPIGYNLLKMKIGK